MSSFSETYEKSISQIAEEHAKMPMGEPIVFSKTYGIQITNDEMLKLMRLDITCDDYENEDDNHPSLVELLDKLPNAYLFDYDGMYAFSGVSYTVDTDDDCEELHAEIVKIIYDYLKLDLPEGAYDD